MQPHKNHSMKRAGEAGSQRRAPGRGTACRLFPAPPPPPEDPPAAAQNARSGPITKGMVPGQPVRKEALQRSRRRLSIHVCIVYVDA